MNTTTTTPPIVEITSPIAPAQEQSQWLWVILIVVFLFAMIAVFVSMRAKRRRLDAEMVDIQGNIETGRGGIGNTGIGNAVGNTKPDESYPYAFDDAQKICNAGGYYGSWSQWLFAGLGGTNMDKIKAVFENKTKGQVASIMEAFSRTTCNQTLDAFMQKYCDEGERKQIYQLIKSAK